MSCIPGPKFKLLFFDRYRQGAFKDFIFVVPSIIILLIGLFFSNSIGMYYEMFLKKIGVPESSVIVQKFQVDEENETFIRNNNYQFDDRTVNRLNKISELLSAAK